MAVAKNRSAVPTLTRRHDPRRQSKDALIHYDAIRVGIAMRQGAMELESSLPAGVTGRPPAQDSDPDHVGGEVGHRGDAYNPVVLATIRRRRCYDLASVLLVMFSSFRSSRNTASLSAIS